MACLQPSPGPEPEPGPSSGADVDVLIVGAGISGLAMAAELARSCPWASCAVLERRAALGGTWDLFRYPGVRSDSDMRTLGFSFAPWPHAQGIADGPLIRAYLEDVARQCGILPRIRFNRRVLGADWSASEALWRVRSCESESENGSGSGEQSTRARWLYLACGYYDHDEPHDPRLPGIENFAGVVARPQFWPEGLDPAGKRVVVIGSGATAVSLVPALAQSASAVVMLQRTPSWLVAQPRRDPWQARVEGWLPPALAHRLLRQKSLAAGQFFFRLARRRPARAAAMLRRMLRRELGPAYDPRHFEPPYDPWRQRLCLVADGDLFAAIRASKVRMATGPIARVEADGVRLETGEHLPADLLVPATGLKLALAGKMPLSLNRKPIDFTEHFFYRSAMLSNVPNLSLVFGYLNASWTLRAENTARLTARILGHLRATCTTTATPHLPLGAEPEAVAPFDFSSGYLERARDRMPRSAATLPWRLHHDYYEDCRDLRTRPVADGVLRFANPGASR